MSTRGNRTLPICCSNKSRTSVENFSSLPYFLPPTLPNTVGFGAMQKSISFFVGLWEFAVLLLLLLDLPRESSLVYSVWSDLGVSAGVD